MTEGNFVDYIKLYVASGNGGKGSAHLHREKYITKGGPDGGDGHPRLSLRNTHPSRMHHDARRS